MVKRKGGGNRTLHHSCGCLVVRSKMNAAAHLGAANCVEICAHFPFCVPLTQPPWWVSVSMVLPLFSNQVQLSSDSKPLLILRVYFLCHCSNITMVTVMAQTVQPLAELTHILWTKENIRCARNTWTCNHNCFLLASLEK